MMISGIPLRVVEPAFNRRVEQRGTLERVLDLAEHLPAADRLFLEQVYRHGIRTTDLARLSGYSVRALRRRRARLLRRLRRPAFTGLVVYGPLLPPPSRRVAELVVFHGRSIRRVAAATGLSLYAVRQHLGAVQALARLERQGRTMAEREN